VTLIKFETFKSHRTAQENRTEKLSLPFSEGDSEVLEDGVFRVGILGGLGKGLSGILRRVFEKIPKV
jgi:hypothetical protein